MNVHWYQHDQVGTIHMVGNSEELPDPAYSGWTVREGNATLDMYHDFSDGAPKPIVLPDEELLTQHKQTAAALVNNAANTIRKQFVTPIVGQDMIYLRKEQEARLYLAESPAPADLSAYPMMAAEVGVTASTPHDLATLWITMAATWTAAAAQIESIRIARINNIRDAESLAEIDQEVAAAQTALEQISPQIGQP